MNDDRPQAADERDGREERGPAQGGGQDLGKLGEPLPDDPVARLADRWRGAAAPRRPRRARPRAPEDVPWSSPGPDERDPTALGAAVDHLGGDDTWSRGLRTGRLLAHWSGLVGPELAAHVRPVDLRDGVLHLDASSPVWGTQVRLLRAALLARIADALGDDLVRDVVVRGAGGSRASAPRPAPRTRAARRPGRGPRPASGAPSGTPPDSA